MKKLLILTLFIIPFTSFTQTKIGYKFGFASTGINYTAPNTILTYKNGIGFHAGFFLDIMAGDDFFLQPTVQFVKHTAIAETKTSSISATDYYIDTPFNMVFKFYGFQLGGGPKWSFATSNGETRFGLNALAGYSLSERTSIQINYSFDLNKEYFNKKSLGISLLGTFGK